MDILKNRQPLSIRISAGFDEATGEERFLVLKAECEGDGTGKLPLMESAAVFYPAAEKGHNKERTIEKIVTAILDRMGIPPHLNGYGYLRDAIVLSVIDRDHLNAVTKVLYPAVAKKNNTTGIKVERGIRTAIETAFKKYDQTGFVSFFRFYPDEKRIRPTNSQVIALISDKVRLEQDKAE